MPFKRAISSKAKKDLSKIFTKKRMADAKKRFDKFIKDPEKVIKKFERETGQKLTKFDRFLANKLVKMAKLSKRGKR